MRSLFSRTGHHPTAEGRLWSRDDDDDDGFDDNDGDDPQKGSPSTGMRRKVEVVIYCAKLNSTDLKPE